GATESAGKNPKAVAINASGEVVYVAASGDNEIRSYSVAGDGTLTAGQSGFSGQGAVSLLASPSGKVLYVVNQVDSSVLWYGVSDVGLVSSTGTAPLGITIDPGESHVLVSNLASANLTRFSVAEDGTLSVEETVATGLAPQGVAISGYTE
ncbi:MAG: beta-propeller fold lactonase family protein, partial [Alloalcanivorax xenomutans]